MTRQVFNSVNEIWKIQVINKNKDMKQLYSVACNTAHNDPVQPDMQESYQLQRKISTQVIGIIKTCLWFQDVSMYWNFCV